MTDVLGRREMRHRGNLAVRNREIEIPCEDGGSDWSNVPTRQCMQRTGVQQPKLRERHRRDSLLGSSEGTNLN